MRAASALSFAFAATALSLTAIANAESTDDPKALTATAAPNHSSISMPPIATVPARSPWSVRLAATYLQSVDGSSNKAVPVDVEDKWIPELDINYAFTSHWSAELVLTIPQKHTVKSAGTKLGTLSIFRPRCSPNTRSTPRAKSARISALASTAR